MRVLHFFKTYFPDTVGGIEQVIAQLCDGSTARGIEARVLTLSRDPHPSRIAHGLHPVRRVREQLNVASTGFGLGALSAFREEAAAADLVHYHFPWPFMDLLQLAGLSDKPYLVSYHSDVVKQQRLLQLYQPVMHRFLGGAQHILVSSPNYLQSSAVLQKHQSRCRLVPYGLDDRSYPTASADVLAKWRARLPQRFFLFVGVLRYYKGLTFLLDALAGQPWPLVIAGAGPEESALKAQVERLGLTAQVHFVGRIDELDKAALFELCHAFVFPSHLRSESFGISLLEAAMYGKALVSCEIGTGTSYINEHGETGLLVEPASALSLRKALATLMENDAVIARMGQAARQRYEALFTQEKMVERVVELYSNTLESYRKI